MSSWSAWNVTGSLNSEVIRLLGEIQVNLATLQNTKVTKGGDAVTGAGNRLTIGTTTNNEVELVSNNQSCFRLTPDGNVFLPNQMLVDSVLQDNQHPNICGALNTNTGISIEGPDMVQFVGNGNLTAQIDTNNLIVNSNTIRFGDENGPRLQHSGNNFNIETIGNHALNLFVQGSKGVTLTKSNNDLDISTTTAGNGTTQVRINGTGTVSRPQYSFSNKTDTGVFLSNDGYLTMSQDGSQVFRCFATGVDMTADQIFFNTQSGPTYYPQICWDSTDLSRDTGLYSPGNGILRFQNNALDSLHVSDNILSHLRCHMNSVNGWLAVNNSYPSFGSAELFDSQFKITYLRSVGADMQATGTCLQLSYRVGNVVHGTIQGIVGDLPQTNCNFANLTQIKIEVSVPNKYGGSRSLNLLLSDGITNTSLTTLSSAGQFFLRNPTTHEVKTFVFSDFSREDLAMETFRFIYSQPPGYLWTGGATQSNNTQIAFGGSFTYLVFESVDNNP